MQLRPLTSEDGPLYERIYTDPAMWTELGGVVEQDMAAKLDRDVAAVEADRHHLSRADAAREPLAPRSVDGVKLDVCWGTFQTPRPGGHRTSGPALRGAGERAASRIRPGGRAAS